MENKAYRLGSFANNNPCLQAYLTKKESRKKDMFMMRYAALGLGHVVVALVPYKFNLFLRILRNLAPGSLVIWSFLLSLNRYDLVQDL